LISLFLCYFYNVHRLTEAVSSLENMLQDQGEKLGRIQRGLEHLAKVQRESSAEKQSVPSFGFSQELVLMVVMVVVLQSLLTWLLCHK
jgi:hypothetical protein